MARDSRIVLQGVARERLAVAGDRIRHARGTIAHETRVAALLLDPALSSGLGPTEAAELLGMTRQSVYELRRRGVESVGSDELGRRLLAYLAGGGAAPASGLVERAHRDEGAVQAALYVLEEARLVEPAVMQYERGVPEKWFRVTDAGIAALEEWLWQSDARPQLWSIYVPMAAEDRAALVRVALDVFGAEWFAVVEPGTIRGQKVAELAFNVVADSYEDAITQGGIRTRELYEAAGITGAWAIRAVLPADAWRAEFRTGA